MEAGGRRDRPDEPPGFFACNYGWSTGVVIVVAHVAFGAALGVGASLVG